MNFKTDTLSEGGGLHEETCIFDKEMFNLVF